MFTIIKEENKKRVQSPVMTKKDFGGWYQIDTNLEQDSEYAPRTIDRNELAKQRVADFHTQQAKEKPSHTAGLRSKTAKAPSVALLVKAALVYMVSGHSI